MYPNGDYDKKALNMLILDILKEYTDSEHRLKQEDIIRLLEQNYGMKCDRRSVKNNLVSLQSMNYDIPLKGGYYLMNRIFDAGELRQLIDSVIFAPHLSKPQRNHLIERLIRLGNRYFQPKVKYIAGLPETPQEDVQGLRATLDALSDAIEQKRKIRFTYNEYDKDFTLRPVSELLANPYQMLANDGKYYLVANEEERDDISYYRVDQITGIVPLDERARPRNYVPAFVKGFKLPKNRAERQAMNIGERVEVRLRTTPSMMGKLMDGFGKDFQVEEQSDGMMTVKLSTNEEAAFRWAMRYGDEVDVLEPEGLRERIREAVTRMMEVYL